MDGGQVAAADTREFVFVGDSRVVPHSGLHPGRAQKPCRLAAALAACALGRRPLLFSLIALARLRSVSVRPRALRKAG